MIISILASYALNAQTCITTMPESTPTARFTDNKDGTVTDNQTLLMWKRCTEGVTLNDNGTPDDMSDDFCAGTLPGVAYSWQGGLQHIDTINTTTGFTGKNDWRLPNIKELTSIVELSCNNPAINLSVFPDAPDSNNSFAGEFWSSSVEISLSSYFRTVKIYTGEDGWRAKTNSLYVRLVRSK